MLPGNVQPRHCWVAVEEFEDILWRITALDTQTRVPEELLSWLSRARFLLGGKQQQRVNTLRSERPGRPAMSVSKEQLEILLGARFYLQFLTLQNCYV